MLPADAKPLSNAAHRWAWVLACATFPLVWWGGFVTATGSGMAFREWLMPDGAFMPLYPWLNAAGDKFIEHGHRLLAMAVGLLTIALVIVAHRFDRRRSVRIFSIVLLAGVLLQGLLGGLRVVLDERLLALLHGCLGPLFFAGTAAMVALSSPSTCAIPPVSLSRPAAGDRAMLRLAIATAVLVYLQLVLGAIVRHSPHLLGDRAAATFQAAVVAHVSLALVVVVQTLRLAAASARQSLARPAAFSMAGLVVFQLLLGGATWLVKYGVPHWAVGLLGEWQFVNTEADLHRAAIITAHGAVGALLVALSVVVALEAGRRIGFEWRRLSATAAKGAVA